MSEAYDLVVIGAGSAGVRAARISAGYGAKVAIIEEYRVGGTCVIRGCVPKKLFVYAARYKDLFEIAPGFGWDVGEPTFDWPTLVANKDKEIARLEAAYVAGLERPGAEIIRERAVVTGPNSVKLLASGRELEAKTILVATGAHPFIPDIPGKELGITSNEVFHLKKLPHSILIEGGGYVATEFATVFAGLGVPTTIVYRGDCGAARLRPGPARGARRRPRGPWHQAHLPDQCHRAHRVAGNDIRVSFSDGVDAPFGAGAVRHRPPPQHCWPRPRDCRRGA